MTKYCSKCPNNAIEFNEECWDCVVNPDKCLGQRFVTRKQKQIINGREIYERKELDSCWECFDGTETIGQSSNKCHRIKKVLHLTGSCCAHCPSYSKTLGLDLMGLCEYGAISIDSEMRGNTLWPFFVVDKDECKGCMVCYYNLNCSNHGGGYTDTFEDSRGNANMKMAAYITPILRIAESVRINRFDYLKYALLNYKYIKRFWFP